LKSRVVSKSLAASHATQIVLAEDDTVLAELMTRLLQKQGFSVLATSDGDQLLAAIEAKRPDLIILDIMIPGLSGFELLRLLKTHQFYRDIPVVMLSAKAGERDQVQAFDFGAADFIRKPFKFEELVARIKRVLAGQRAVEWERNEL
jgi:two-component system phosphate regulon response regulator PhoB